MARSVPGGGGRKKPLKEMLAKRRWEYRDEFPNAPYRRIPRARPPVLPNRRPDPYRRHRA